MADRSRGRVEPRERERPWSSRLGVGGEANNLTPEKKKTALFRNVIEAKNGLIFWSDTVEGKD